MPPAKHGKVHLKYWVSNTDYGLKIKSKNNSKKLARLKKGVTFATRKIREVLKEIGVKTERKFFQKKVSKSFARLKKSSTFAAANRKIGEKIRRIRS